jgi:hypothetical protein
MWKSTIIQFHHTFPQLLPFPKCWCHRQNLNSSNFAWINSSTDFDQRDKAHRLCGGFFPLTGAAVGYASPFFSGGAGRGVNAS